MSTYDDFDRRITTWLEATAPSGEPDLLLGRVLATTAATRRRPAWRVPERWLSMSAITASTAAMGRVPWRPLALAVLLVLALVAGALFVAGAQRPAVPPPFGPAANGTLAFSVAGDILVVDSPLAKPHAILAGSTFDNGPLFSPDGKRMAFVRGPIGDANAEMWVAGSDGSSARKLVAVPQIGWAEWSPQSDTLAVVLDGKPGTIMLIDAETGSSTELGTGLQGADGVTWRPSDGAQLTFRGSDASGTFGIYVMDRSGANLRRLALDPGFQDDDAYSINSGDYFLSPSWSADGKRLLYYTLEPAPGSPAGPGYRIHVASVDQAGLVTNDRIVEFDAATDDEFAATWLGGEDRILFQTVEGVEHRLKSGTLVAPHGPARDLGLSASDWMATIVAPDTHTAIVNIPAASGSRPDIRSIDLETGASTPTTLAGDDLTWQRLAVR